MATSAGRSQVCGYTIEMHEIHNADPLWASHRITDDLPDDVAKTILQHPSYSEAPEGLLPYAEFTPIHSTPALIQGEPLKITDAERAKLPKLEPLGDGPLEYAVCHAPSKPTAADNRRAALAKANATRAANKAAKG